MTTITIPHKYKHRGYQRSLIKAYDEGTNRGVAVWHRRAGKDLTALSAIMIPKMLERVGTYFFLFPTYKQGKKIIWEGRDGNGIKYLDRFPPEIVRSVNNTEMKVELVNGSVFQIVGTDNMDRIVGTNPVGCVFSEYSLQDPEAWNLIRPILRENGGWSLFIYTPRGKNHGYEIFKMAQDNDKWFCERLTIEDTGVMTEEDTEQERQEGMPEELIQQEFYCSFEGYREGSYYAQNLKKARKEGRISKVPYEENMSVHTAWDLGISDSTAIWFFQKTKQNIRIIDYYENSGESLQHYAKVLQDKPYIYGTHYGPHDLKVRELGTGKSRYEVARSLGINFKIVKKMNVSEGIHAVRILFNKFWFDEDKCHEGLKALSNYHKEWDDKRKEFKKRPYHDWSSHSADALRYLALGYRNPNKIRNVRNRRKKWSY